MLNWKNITGLVFLAAGLGQAHLTASSLIPKGGESLKPGDVVSITWKVDETHGKGIDIALSKDGGTTWANIKTGFADNSKDDKFNWTVPNEPSTNAKLRICQSGPCSNANNVSKPSGESPWVLVSGVFTVQTATGIVSPSASSEGLSMDFHPDSRNMDVSFDLASDGAVRLQAFDTQGRLVATLIEGNYAAGKHSFSVFSNRLSDAAGSLVFKLNAGERTKTLTWMALR